METEKEIEKEKVTKKQPIKLLTGLKKIASLNLTNEKIDYFQKESNFASLVSIKKGKESSGTLIEALASFYNNVTKIFNFNGKVFSFCADEVAEVLKIPRGDLDMEAFLSTLSKSNSYPGNLYEIRNMLVENVKPSDDISAQDMKTIIEKMELETADEKKLFVQLLSFYYIEQFAICGAKLTYPRSSIWKYVLDMKKFNTVDWPAIICNHLKISMSEAHAHVSEGKSKQHSFKGCAPVLEAILFQRLHKLYSGSMSTDLSPPVQIYNAQRRTVDEWKSLLLGCEITECGHCPSPVSTDEGASESPKRSTPSADTPSSSPPTSPLHNPIPLERHLLEEVCESVSALQLIPEEEGRGRGGRKGKVVPPPRAKAEREKKKPESALSDAYGQAASNLVAGSNQDQIVEQLMDMGGGSWDRDMVLRALRAAYNNPERAVDYLYSGIPASAEIAVPVASNITEAPTTESSPLSGLPNSAPLDMFPQGAPGSGAGALVGSLGFLRNNPQFRTLRAMVQANPQILQPMLQELSKQNPQLLRLIQDNHAEFLRLINDPVEEAEGVDALAAQMLGTEGELYDQPDMEMPHTVNVRPEEQLAIERLEAMGFDRARVVEAFLACDRNEELAANYLLEHTGDED